jgi:RNAse (barnase) inhibitor barstar
MAHKRKGQLTNSAEWAKHLRSYLKREFWKGERKAEKDFIEEELMDSYEVKSFTIDGNDFKTLEEFFECIGEQLVENNSWGKNMNAFNDILWGGFIKTEYEEPFILVWNNSKVSAETLSDFDDLIDLILEHKHIKLILN